jgi:hypothetical protein
LRVQLDPERSCDCPEVRDPYSFRISIVVPSWSPRFRDMRFRRLVEDTLRREAPAHVFVRICWLSHEQMKQLERALEDWQSKLAALAREPAGCGDADDSSRTGRLPLRPASTARDEEYALALERLITGSGAEWSGLQNLTTVYPLAQLHDCDETMGDTPQVTLNNTSLGTL